MYCNCNTLYHISFPCVVQGIKKIDRPTVLIKITNFFCNPSGKWILKLCMIVIFVKPFLC